MANKIKCSHILVKKQSEALAIQERLKQGEKFGKLAKELSIDPGSAKRDGNLGYFGRGAMVKPFEEEAFSLEVGKISDVVETQFGYHIIKVTDRQSARTLSYKETESDIAMFLLNQRRMEALDKLVKELRDKARIEIY